MLLALLVAFVAPSLGGGGAVAQTSVFPGFENVDGLRRVESDGWVVFAEDPYTAERFPRWLSMVQVAILEFSAESSAGEGYDLVGDALVDFWWSEMTRPAWGNVVDVDLSLPGEEIASELHTLVTEVNPGEDDQFRTWATDNVGLGTVEYPYPLSLALATSGLYVILVAVMAAPDEDIDAEDLGPLPSELEPLELSTSVAFETTAQAFGSESPFYPTRDVLGDLYVLATSSSLFDYDPVLYVSPELVAERRATETAEELIAAKEDEVLRSVLSDGWMAIVDSNGDLRLERSDTGEVVQIHGVSGVRDPAWSPDGTMLAYAVESGGIMIYQGGRADVVTSASCTNPEFTPDAKTLLFTCERGSGDETSYGMVTAFDLETESLSPLVPFWGSSNEFLAFDIRASDGVMLIVDQTARSNGPQLRLYEADGTLIAQDDRFATVLPINGYGPVSAQFVGDDGILGWVCANACATHEELSGSAELYLIQSSGQAELIPITAPYPFVAVVADDRYVTTNGGFLFLRDSDGTSTSLTRGVDLAWQPVDVDITTP